MTVIVDFSANRDVDFKHEDLSHLVNGLEDTFETSMPYVENSLDVRMNGLPLVRNADNGFIFIDSTHFQCKEPPPVGAFFEIKYVVL